MVGDWARKFERRHEVWRDDIFAFREEVLGAKYIWKGHADLLRLYTEHERVAAAACHESSKALALSTPLPTPTGWTTMGDVRVGDRLLNEDGSPVVVTTVSPIRMRPAYLLTFCDGSQLVADGDHWWNAIDIRHRPRRVADWRHHWCATRRVTTDQMRASLRRSGQLRWRIPVSAPLQTDEPWRGDLTPYALGAWIGDGDSARAWLTCHEDDRSHFEREVGAILKRRDQRNPNVVSLALLDRPVRDCPSKATGGVKRIPSAALRASPADRLEFLRGLMDADGSLGNRGSCVISQSSLEIASSIRELIVSLGWVARWADYPAKIDGREVGRSYVVTFRPDVVPFRLPRKRDEWLRRDAACGSQRSRRTQRTVRSIEPVGVTAVRCVGVDSPRHLYLAGRGMIPTHNTHAISEIAWHRAICFTPSKLIGTAPGGRQAEAVLGAAIRQRHVDMHRHLGFDTGIPAPRGTGWDMDRERAPQWFMRWFATSPDTSSEVATKMLGHHSPHMTVLFEEADGIDRVIWTSALGLMTGGRTRRWVAIGNPHNPSSQFSECFRSPIWATMHMDAYDHPNVKARRQVLPFGVTWEWVQDMLTEFGEDHPHFQSKVRGQFPTTADDTLIAVGDVMRAEKRAARPISAVSTKHPATGKLVPPPIGIGVDVARQGSDLSVIFVVQADRIIGWKVYNKPDTMGLVGLIIRMAQRHKIKQIDEAHRISIDDSGGGGWGVVDRLRELGWNVNREVFGAGPRTDSMMLNRRIELWWGLRNWIRNEACLSNLPRELKDRLRHDMTAPKLLPPRSDGKLQLEKKEKIKKRIGRSPDYADALALALAWRTAGMPFVAKSSGGGSEPSREIDEVLEGFGSPGSIDSVMEGWQ